MKKAISIMLLVLSAAIMVSGLTIAYFYDKSDDIQIPFTTGILKMEMMQFPEDIKNWKPGEIKKLEWTFKNTGTRKAYLKVAIDSGWNGIEIEEDIGSVDWVIHNDENWEEKDGYYYYIKPVMPNETVSIGFDIWYEIKFKEIVYEFFTISALLDSEAIENYVMEKCLPYREATYRFTLTLESSEEEWIY